MELFPDVFTLGDILLSLVIFAGGIILNWVQKCLTLNIDSTAYWTEYGARSITSVAAGIVAYFGLLQAEQMDPAIYFMTGFMCDSLINKMPVVSTRPRV